MFDEKYPLRPIDRPDRITRAVSWKSQSSKQPSLSNSVRRSPSMVRRGSSFPGSARPSRRHLDSRDNASGVLMQSTRLVDGVYKGSGISRSGGAKAKPLYAGNEHASTIWSGVCDFNPGEESYDSDRNGDHSHPISWSEIRRYGISSDRESNSFSPFESRKDLPSRHESGDRFCSICGGIIRTSAFYPKHVSNSSHLTCSCTTALRNSVIRPSHMRYLSRDSVLQSSSLADYKTRRPAAIPLDHGKTASKVTFRDFDSEIETCPPPSPSSSSGILKGVYEAPVQAKTETDHGYGIGTGLSQNRPLEASTMGLWGLQTHENVSQKRQDISSAWIRLFRSLLRIYNGNGTHRKKFNRHGKRSTK